MLELLRSDALDQFVTLESNALASQIGAGQKRVKIGPRVVTWIPWDAAP